MNDWSVFLDTDDFADLAAWDTQAGDFAQVPGIFEAAREVVLPGDGVGISAVLPVLTVADDAIPATASQGDDLEVRGANYLVADIQPDGSGLTRIILERA